MRIRNALAVLGAATMITAFSAAPAAAGTGYSTWCGDTQNFQAVAVNSPVTVGVEVVKNPTTGHWWVIVCFSNTPWGTPGQVGGTLSFEMWPGASTTTPGATFMVKCLPDGAFCPNSTVVGSGHVTVSDVGVGTGYACLVDLGGACYAYAPGLTITTNNSPAPLLSVTLAGIPVTLDAPAPHCVSVIVRC